MHAAIGSSPFRRLQLRRFRSAVMLRILFFFIRGGGKLLEITIRLLPLGNQQEWMLFDRFIITAKSTRKVTLLIGGLQGMLGALAFWIVGIEGPMLWGLIMVVTTIVLRFFRFHAGADYYLAHAVRLSYVRTALPGS
ncbi:hypothetical protein ACJ77P_13465 [Syntrophus buswellii]|uniref:hypothetical protein n=1 Tax=Syntrophus buswellii TaxID=43774 RepID=UPI0038D3B55F